jgi:hypothetical protein
VELGMAAIRASYKFSFRHESCFTPRKTPSRAKGETEASKRSPKRCVDPPDAHDIFFDRWELLAEYRWLEDFAGDNRRQGALVGLYKEFDSRHRDAAINNTIRVGIGYNFSGFDDRLRSESYKADGWFVDFMVVF